ncbi:MAG: Ger(x)C family spore germination protein [Clostridia bacterium]|nr:Ger(x)C family spore germination protein [Clostridia bacterium]
MHTRKYLILIYLLVFLFTASGCWDRRELNELALATCVGIDLGEDPQHLQMTVEIVLPENISTPGGASGQGKPTFTVKSQGLTAFEAARKLTLNTEERIYFAHNPVVVFGEEMALNGIAPAFDFFIRDPEPRRTAWMLVSEQRAEEIVNIDTMLEPITGIYINKLIEEIVSNSLIASMSVQDFLERLMSPTSSPYCSLIRAKKENDSIIMELTGTAIFKKDKMVGKFDYTEGRGLLWVLGEVKSGIIVVPCENDSNVALEIIRSQSKIIPSITDNTLKITIKVKEEGNLGEQQCPYELTTPQAWSSLEKKKAEAIRQEILAAVRKAQELNTDVFGFGEAFHRKYPKLWKEQLKQNWDVFFPEIEVEILVEAKLRRTGMISKPGIPD